MAKNTHSPANYGKAMTSAYKNTKVMGMPMKKMSADQVAKRKRTTISNAAHKAFNSQYSK